MISFQRILKSKSIMAWSASITRKHPQQKHRLLPETIRATISSSTITKTNEGGINDSRVGKKKKDPISSKSKMDKKHLNGDDNNQQRHDDEMQLNWKERKEAPKWIQRFAPPKGGKWPPQPHEAIILATGLALFILSWTV